jgi:integrase
LLFSGEICGDSQRTHAGAHHAYYHTRVAICLVVAEIKAGRILNSKTRKPIRTNTTDYYSTAVAYLNEVIGNNPLASLDNPEARHLVSKMKAELKDNERGFSDKTIVEFFKVFTRVIASAKDEKLRQVYPREWDLAYIGLPKVSKREQHRPTFTAKEIVHIIKSCKRAIYRVAVVLLVATRNPNCRIACSRNREAHLS